MVLGGFLTAKLYNLYFLVLLSKINSRNLLHLVFLSISGLPDFFQDPGRPQQEREGCHEREYCSKKTNKVAK